MLGKQAKIVSPDTLRRMLDYTGQTRQPKRDAVIVLLSVKAGLSWTLRISSRVAKRFGEFFHEGDWNFHTVRRMPRH